MKQKSYTYLLVFLLLLIVAPSCSVQDDLQFSFKEVDPRGWYSKNPISFSFVNTKSTSPYYFSLVVRYNNLCTRKTHKFLGVWYNNKEIVRRDTIILNLSDKTSERAALLYEKVTSFPKVISFPTSGWYNFLLYPLSRDSLSYGIESVGLVSSSLPQAF